MQSIYQKISVWRIRSQAYSTNVPHIHKKERISYLFAIWWATPSKLTITQIVSYINKWFPTQRFKIFPWETLSEEMKLSFWELYFFFSGKEQCECEGRPLVCSGSIVWVTKHTKNDWGSLAPHQVTSGSSRNITEADCESGPISAFPCTRA